MFIQVRALTIRELLKYLLETDYLHIALLDPFTNMILSFFGIFTISLKSHVGCKEGKRLTSCCYIFSLLMANDHHR